MLNVDKETLKKMRQISWYPGRAVPNEVERWKRELDEFVIFDVAETVLLEFGGLRNDEDGPGLEAARSRFRLDPALACGERGRFEEFETEIDCRLYPLGEACGGAVFLAIAEDARVYLMERALWLAGDDIWDALDRFIRGRKQPIVVDYPSRGD